MSVFHSLDYREAIIQLVEDSKGGLTQFTYTGMAEAARVQKPYVTRVSKKQAHFNSDQLYLICEYLRLGPEETDYMMLLLEYGRSALAPRKRALRKVISDIQAKHLDTRKHLRAEQVSPPSSDQHVRYYLDPMAPLVHTFLSLPQFARDPKAIAAKLDVTEKRMTAILKNLEDLGIVKWDANAKGYRVIRDHMQLVADSPVNLPYQIFQRTNAIHKIQTQSLEDRFIFSVAFSADEKTRTEIHGAFLRFLRKTESLVKAAQPTEVYQINFDLFGW